jgi:hypothetical protein
MYKKASSVLVSRLILLLVALIFILMLFNVGDRFLTKGGVFAKYHLMESAYVMETLLASPSSAVLNYHFDLNGFNFKFDNESYSVNYNNFDSGIYKFTFDKNVKIHLSPFSEFNYFQRSTGLTFSDKTPSYNDYLCPVVDSSLQNPILLIGILNENIENKNNLMAYYNSIYQNYKKGQVLFEDISQSKKITVNNDLSIVFSDSESEIDIIIFYKPSLSNAKIACMIFDNINSINENDVKIILVPTNHIFSDLQININFATIGALDVQIPSKVSNSVEEYFT